MASALTPRRESLWIAGWLAIALWAGGAQAQSSGNSQAQLFLKQVTVVDDLQQIQANGVAPGALPVDVRGPDFLRTPEFAAVVEPYLGRPLTQAIISALVKDIFAYAKSHGHSLVDVIVPEQAVDRGVVQIALVEFKAGKLTITGNHWFSDSALRHDIHLKEGEVLDDSSLVDDVLAINQNPFRQASIIYERTGVDRANVEVAVKDRFPLRAYAGYDTTGQQSLSRERVFVGFDWGDAFGLDQVLSYQYRSSTDLLTGIPDVMDRPDLPQFQSHSASYTLPTFGNQRLTLSGAYEEQVPILESGLNSVGKSWELSARYIVPLPVGRGLTQEVHLGVDFKRSNTQQEFTGVQIFNSDTDILQGVLEYALKYDDPHDGNERFGTTGLTLSLYGSPGGLTADNTTSQFQIASPGAKADYVYLRLAAERTTPLPGAFSWYIGGQAQWASAALLSSEQLFLGGVGTIRGYDQDSFGGDEGALLRNELRFNVLGADHALFSGIAAKEPWLNDQQLQLFGFWDVGWVTHIDSQFGQPDSATLQSVGLGLRYWLGNNISVQGDYGWQLNALAGQPAGQQGDIAITIAY